LSRQLCIGTWLYIVHTVSDSFSICGVNLWGHHRFGELSPPCLLVFS
jgi:hypothetical protein